MLSIVMLINRIGAMVLPFLGIYMTTQLGFTLPQTGIVLSCFGIGAMAGSALGGWLTDQYGHFKVQLFSTLLSVPMFFLLSTLTTVVSLAIGVFVLSLITETFRPANSVSISVYAKPENITRSFSLNRMALNLGFSIGPALGGILAAISFKLLFYGNGIAAALAGLIFYFFFKNLKGNTEYESSIHERRKNKSKSGISPWKDKPFLVYSLYSCFYSVCFFQLLSTLPLYYREIHLLSEAKIGLILAFNGLVVFALEMLLVQIAERKLRSSQAIIWGVILCSASFFVLLMPGGMWVLLFSMFLLSISEILSMPFMSTVTVKRGSKDRQGSYMGLNALSFSSAHVLSPLIGTYVAQHYGFSNLWIATGILGLLTAVGFHFVFKRF